MNNQTFYFWNNGRIYRGDKPTLDIPIGDELVVFEGHDVYFNAQIMHLKAIAVSYFDEEEKQRVFILNIPGRPEIRFSNNFPFPLEFERTLIGAFVELRDNVK